MIVVVTRNEAEKAESLALFSKRLARPSLVIYSLYLTSHFAFTSQREKGSGQGKLDIAQLILVDEYYIHFRNEKEGQ